MIRSLIISQGKAIILLAATAAAAPGTIAARPLVSTGTVTAAGVFFCVELEQLLRAAWAVRRLAVGVRLDV